jgi:copper oxidase (laccase) domain-containing protein
MNVYKIGIYWIASKDPDSAFNYYLDVTDGDFSFYDIKEGESDEYRIKIYRLTEKEMNSLEVMCCFDGCDECEGKDEPLLFSYREMMAKQNKFPCIVCREE